MTLYQRITTSKLAHNKYFQAILTITLSIYAALNLTNNIMLFRIGITSILLFLILLLIILVSFLIYQNFQVPKK
jgi:hypothetical protein